MNTTRGPLVPPAVDTLPINFAILDSEGDILLTNRAWQNFGRENDIAIRPDTLGVNYLEITEQAADETAQTVATGLRELLAGEQDLFEIEYPCHSPTEKRWFLMRAAPFTADETRYAAVAHIDITKRKEAERASHRFERAVDTAGHAVFLTDPDGEITYINPAFEKITGYGPEEAIGQTPRILKSGETSAEVYADLWETITGGSVWEGMLLNRRQSGELYYAQLTVAPVHDETGEIVEFVAMQTDITALKESQKQLEKLENLLRHDVRNQLNVIQGRSELLQRDEGSVAESAAAIATAAERLLSVTENAREITEFLSSTTSAKPRDVASLVRDVADTTRADTPHATVTVDAPERAVALAVSQLEVALSELVENGIVHNDSAEPRVVITVEETSDRVLIHIADNGTGLPEVEHISLESDTVSPLYHDTGAGLNLAYWIVRRSGGNLSFGENDPRGAVVTIDLLRP